MTSNESLLEAIKEKLKTLRLKSCADNIQQILERAEKQNTSTLQVIEMDLAFIRQKKDIIIGHTGLGKSFLAKCIAYAATQAGVGTLFTTAMDMINHRAAAEADHTC